MNKKFGVLFLMFIFSVSLVLAGTTKITVRMNDDCDALIRVMEGSTLIDTPPIKNYPMGLAEFSYDSSRSQMDYLILVHEEGNVLDTYKVTDLDTGSDIKVDFRKGIPPIITDLAALAKELEENRSLELASLNSSTSEENQTLENSPDSGTSEDMVIDEHNMSLDFDFTEKLATGKAVFYSEDSGFTWLSWMLLLILALVIGFFVLEKLKNQGVDDISKNKKELDRIRNKIKKRVREIKILKAKGVKLKKMIELENGFFEEKASLKNISKEIESSEKKDDSSKKRSVSSSSNEMK
jgi:hypothetical protein